MRILKYPLQIVDRQVVRMPCFATIIAAKDQRGTLTLWATTDETMRLMKDRHILIIGTGNPAPDYPGRHIDTVLMDGGNMVWHVFDQTEVQQELRT